MLHDSTKKFVGKPDPMSYDTALHLSLKGLEETRASTSESSMLGLDTDTFSALFIVVEMETSLLLRG